MTDTGDRLPGIYPDTRDHAPPDADIVTDHDRLMPERRAWMRQEYVGSDS